MNVVELIQKLQQLDQTAKVNVYAGYHPEYGMEWSEDIDIIEKAVGWDSEKECQIFKVFIQ